MSRLINPGLGDLIDRLTILALKRLHGAAAGKDTSHFDREWAAIHSMVSARNGSGKWLEAALQLGAVNAHLWQLTDEMRRYTEGIPADVSPTVPAVCGITIFRMNDRRAELVQQINDAAGDPTGLEKL